MDEASRRMRNPATTTAIAATTTSTNSTFSPSVTAIYSRSPAASRARSRFGNKSSETTLPSRSVHTCPTRFSISAVVPFGRTRTL
jgi:hypothetical protein